MIVEQRQWTPARGWTPHEIVPLEAADLVLVFGCSKTFEAHASLERIRQFYPKAIILGCSTAGEIYGTTVADDSVVITAISFEKCTVRAGGVDLSQMDSSEASGAALARTLPLSVASKVPGETASLRHVFVLSEGLKINGSDLVLGLTGSLPTDVTITGGLAGDGEHFGETFVFLNSPPQKQFVAILGFYGEALRVGFGCLGGWDPFGPERLVTKSNQNVLHTLDGKSALGLYKRYLGEYADGLPSTGLFFPISLRTKDNPHPVVRTILGVNEADQSMTFAGNVPEGSYARLMKASFDRLVDGAIEAARIGSRSLNSHRAQLAILVSCIGRKMVLKQRVEEEVEGVREVLGTETVITGFYSYGEISPFTPGVRCELNNQTMTVTTLSEV